MNVADGVHAVCFGEGLYSKSCFLVTLSESLLDSLVFFQVDLFNSSQIKDKGRCYCRMDEVVKHCIRELAYEGELGTLILSQRIGAVQSPLEFEPASFALFF